MLNNVTLMGRLTADPEIRQTQSGLSVASFRIAVERDTKSENGERAADFINCAAWRQSAEFVSKYFHKGNMIALTGRIQTRNYQDKDGNNRTATEVVADRISFTGEKNNDNGNPAYSAPAPAPAQHQQYQQRQAQPPQYGVASSDGYSQQFTPHQQNAWQEISGDDGELPF